MVFGNDSELYISGSINNIYLNPRLTINIIQHRQEVSLYAPQEVKKLSNGNKSMCADANTATLNIKIIYYHKIENFIYQHDLLLMT